MYRKLIQVLIIGLLFTINPAYSIETIGDGSTGFFREESVKLNSNFSELDLSRIPQVTDLSELRDYTGSATSVYVKGHTTAGDGGGGVFNKLSAGGYTDDNGVTIVPTGGDGSVAWVRDFSGEVDIQWYGAVGDLVISTNTGTDNRLAIQAAIDYVESKGRGIVLIPPKNFGYSGELTIQSSYVTIRGVNPVASTLGQMSASANGIVVGHPNWMSAGTRLSGVNFEKFRLCKSIIPTNGVGVIENGVDANITSDFSIIDFPYGYKKVACRNSYNDRLRIAGGSTYQNTVVGSYGLKLTAATRDGGVVERGWVHTFSDMHINGSSDGSIDDLVVLEDNDVANFLGGYWQRGANSMIRVKARDDVDSGDHVLSTSISDVYFDGVSVGFLPYNNCVVWDDIDVPFIGSWLMDSSVTINGLDRGFVLENQRARGVKIYAHVINVYEKTAYIRNANDIEFNISGHKMAGAVNAIIDIAGVDKAVLGLDVHDESDPTNLVNVGAGMGHLDIKNITADSTFPREYLILPTGANKVASIKNTGCQVKYTPALSFDYNSTGITYANRDGRYSIKDGMVSLSASITLSSKGTDTGSARVTYPDTFTPNTEAQFLPLTVENAASGALTNVTRARILTASNYLTLSQMGATTSVNLTDASITDSSVIALSGVFAIVAP